MNDRSKGYSLAELLTMELPPRLALMGEWLARGELVMVHSPRGVGKTMFLATLCYALVAKIPLFGWTPGPRQLITYFNGEMPKVLMQQRYQALVNSYEQCALGDGGIKFVDFDDQYARSLPNLSDPDWHPWYEDRIGDSSVVVFDTYMSMAWKMKGNETDVDIWARIQPWVVKLRSEGKTVIIVHHSGKSGQQLGTSVKEQVLDCVVGLRHPTDYLRSEGCRFELHFEKARSFFGDDANPVEARLHGKLKEGQVSWEWKPVDDSIIGMGV